MSYDLWRTRDEDDSERPIEDDDAACPYCEVRNGEAHSESCVLSVPDEDEREDAGVVGAREAA